MLGRLLIEMSEGRSGKVSQDILKDLRLLPSRSKFNKQIEAWAEAALEELEASPEEE